MHVELDGQVWRIVEFQHVKPGKGGAFVRTKLKSLGSGSVVDKTFRAGEKFERIRTEDKNHAVPLGGGREGRLLARGPLRAAVAAARGGRRRAAVHAAVDVVAGAV